MCSGLFRYAFSVIVLLYCAPNTAGAQQHTSGIATSHPVAKIAPAPSHLTGKERLGRKWMDEQRIDNCKVPPDLRGSKPRPARCPDGPSI